ncbi:monocarboxylate transporter 6-like [Homarus americanus]|uniref:Monocarboxylate transporter 6-like 1 n=1 Tax=Homarus americanus TaxID=6706 RepID=A0A8J5K3I1_HOMAM|nr:monocarboxylate transporter 6-like [Homarus americanus]XP_042227429.1 monocarboxylate transporter 6-like [Homarus americanus]KAG7165898.1 Monocarboxylate transporter 6-like 1 [Homarus americanus]
MSQTDNDHQLRSVKVVNEHTRCFRGSDTKHNQCILRKNLENKTESPREVRKNSVEAECISIPGDASSTKRKDNQEEDNENLRQARGREASNCNGAWSILLGTFIILMLSNIMDTCFSLLFSPLFLDLGTSSTTIGWLFSILQLMWHSAGLFLGPLVKEFGWRKVAMMSSIMISCSVILSAFATSAFFLLVSFSILGGFSSGLLINLCFLIVPHYFTRRRGVANACMMTGSCLGLMIGPVIVGFLQVEFGFFSGTLVFGAVILHCCVGATLIGTIQCQEKANTCLENVNQEPHSQDADNKRNKWDNISDNVFVRVCRNSVTNLSILKNLRGTIIAVGGVLTTNSWLNFLSLMPFAVQAAGHPIQTTRMYMTVSAACNLVARITVCVLSDWSGFSMRACYMTSIAIIAVSTLAFSMVTNIWWQMAIMGVWGCGMGSYMGINNLIIAHYMGLDDMAATLGTMSLLTGVGFIIIGPSIGIVRDVTGSYAVSMWVLAGLAGCSFLPWIFMPAAVRYDHKKPITQLS